MAAYGNGQMLGSGINPESFKQDYSGFARAAATQAQGIANLGDSIGGVIQDFGKQKADQKKVDALNKASAKSIEAALTLGKSYEVAGVEETLRPFLESYNDPNLSPIEKAALLEEGKAMIPNVFGRFDKSQSYAVSKAEIDARNAPPIPEQFATKVEFVDIGGGKKVQVNRGNDGKIYDDLGNIITNVGAYGVGKPLEVYSMPTTSLDNLGVGLFPPDVRQTSGQGISNALQMGSGSTTPSKEAILTAGMVDSALSVPSSSATLTPGVDPAPTYGTIAQATNLGTPIEKPRSFGGEAEVVKKEPVNITIDKLRELAATGVRSKGALNPDGTFSVEGFETGSLPQGMTIKSDGQGGFEMVQGSGVGNAKADQEKKAAESRIDKAMALTQDLNVLEARAESMTPGVAAAVGRVVAENVPTTQQAETKDIIDRVNSTLTFSVLQEMRDNAPTGAALGTVSDTDIKILKSSATALKNAQGPEAFKRELVRLKNLQHDIIYGSGRLLRDKLSNGEITQSQFDEAESKAPSQYIDEKGVVQQRKPTTQKFGLTPNEQGLMEKYKKK